LLGRAQKKTGPVADMQRLFLAASMGIGSAIGWERRSIVG